MSKKTTYSCNICREVKPEGKLLGIVFVDLHNFKFDFPSETEGVHICNDCIKQLKELTIDE